MAHAHTPTLEATACTYKHTVLTHILYTGVGRGENKRRQPGQMPVYMCACVCLKMWSSDSVVEIVSLQS